MRVLVAPDRFSGALTAAHAARALAQGWAERVPEDLITQLPMSDGSAGLLDVVHATCGGRLTSVTVQGPLGAPVPGAVLHVPGREGGTAYVEGDQVLGTHLVHPDDRGRAAAHGTSAGLGELLDAALRTGARRVVLGLPVPAAVHDAGGGLVAALTGAGPSHVLRSGGLAMGLLTAEDLEGLDVLAERLTGYQIVLAVPDDAPLLGLHGAGAILGQDPRVGPERAQHLERALGHATELMDRQLGARSRPGLPLAGERPGGPARGARRPSSGAGGGVAYLLRALGARALPGADVVADAVGLAARMDAADLVLTGAGTLDAPSLTRSVVATVGRHAMARGLPVVAVADEVRTSRREVAQIGVSGTYEVLPRRREDTAVVSPPGSAVQALAERAARLARTWSA